jgi:hypothetical protein
MDFLRKVYLKTGSLQNWLPPQFENNHMELASCTIIWEEDGHIVAVANPEVKDLYFMQVDPDYEFLEPQILEHIEDNAIAGNADKISIITLEGNHKREALLRERGYHKGKVYGIQQVRPLNTPIPRYVTPEGYIIRTVEPEKDFKKIALAIRAVFGHKDFSEKILITLSKASFYQQKMDIVAVTPEDEVASFLTFRIDPKIRVTE